jgi:hypothetical protein
MSNRSINKEWVSADMEAEMSGWYSISSPARMKEIRSLSVMGFSAVASSSSGDRMWAKYASTVCEPFYALASVIHMSLTRDLDYEKNMLPKAAQSA